MRPQQANDNGDRPNAKRLRLLESTRSTFVAVQSDIGGFAATLITFDNRLYTTGRYYPTKEDAIAAIGDYYFRLESAKGWPW